MKSQSVCFANRNCGLSIIELVVTFAVVATVAVLTIGGFPTNNVRSALRKEVEKTALDLRVAQNNAISGKVPSGSSATPRYWGIYFDINQPNQYIIFADVNGNKQYNAGTDTGMAFFFESGVTINRLRSFSGGDRSQLGFFFSVPYGETEIFYDNSTSNVTQEGTVRLGRTFRSQPITWDVRMRVSGQITVTAN